MTTLHLEFNCLCLFVRDETNKVVHVLMPATHGGEDRHVVMLYHGAGSTNGVGMEGLEWVLGKGKGPASLASLGTTAKGEIIDVTVESKADKKAARDLVTTPHRHVLSRVTLHAGRVINRGAQATWTLNGRDVLMAHRVVWEIDDVPDAQTWNPLRKEPHAVPLQSLAQLGSAQTLPGGKSGHHLRIFHTTQGSLPPNDENGELDEAAVRRHFAHFYHLLRHTPIGGQLPSTPREVNPPKPKDLEEGSDPSIPPLVKTYNCGAAQAVLE